MLRVLITGGSSGLGKELVKTISNYCHVDFTYNKSKKSAEKLIQENKNTNAYKVDFGSIEENSFIREIKNSDYDVVIHNFYCGKFLDKHFIKYSPEDLLNAIVLNISPVILMSQNVISKMNSKGRGLIIFISSESINTNPSGSFIYTSVKSIIENISRSIQSENKKIDCEIIRPSIMKTNLTSDIDERVLDLYFNYDPNEIKSVVSHINSLIKSFKNDTP